MQAVGDALSRQNDFRADPIGEAVKSVAADLNVKAGAVVHPTRLACTGAPAGPSLYHLMEIIGKERTLERISSAVGKISG